MMLPPQTRDLAQRLLAYQNAAGKTSEPTEFAAFGVCERLRQPLLHSRELPVFARCFLVL